MNEVWLSGIGILLALAGMTLLIFRRVSPIIVGPLAALLVTNVPVRQLTCRADGDAVRTLEEELRRS